MKRATKRLTYCALMCALLVVSTLFLRFTIPGLNMLITPQVFFVLLCGQVLGVRDGALTVGAYVAMGLIGLPVFSSVSGLAALATPSFGYLLGFIAGAATTAALCKRARSVWGRLAANGAGLTVIYAVALPYIAALKGLYLGAPIDFSTLVTAYCLAFLPADILKAILAAPLAMRLAPLVK